MSSSALSLESARRTSAFYDANAQAYAAQTAGMDMAEAYRPFLAVLPAGARILDAGCGSGRDSAAFRALGYQVVATEPCAALAREAELRAGVDVFPFRHESLPFSQAFDGIWACATLLHVERSLLRGTLRRFVTALAPGGVLYATFKAGESDGFDADGRWFTRVTVDTLRDMALTLPSCRVESITESRDGTRPNTRWIALMVRRNPLVLPLAAADCAQPVTRY